MSTLNDLPQLPLSIIAKTLCNDHIHKVAINAANLALVGNPVCTLLAEMIWSNIDPNGKDIVIQEHTKDMEEWNELRNNIHTRIENIPEVPEVTVNENNTVAEIKKFCNTIPGCKMSGSKIVILESLHDSINKLTQRRNKKIENMYKHCETPPSFPRCFVSTQEKSKILEFKQQRITLTTAKTKYKLNLKELESLDCIVKQNPYYRHAAPMRLYKLIDVLEIVDAKRRNQSVLS